MAYSYDRTSKPRTALTWLKVEIPHVGAAGRRREPCYSPSVCLQENTFTGTCSRNIPYCRAPYERWCTSCFPGVTSFGCVVLITRWTSLLCAAERTVQLRQRHQAGQELWDIALFLSELPAAAKGGFAALALLLSSFVRNA
jgi:hypothetical protein